MSVQEKDAYNLSQEQEQKQEPSKGPISPEVGANVVSRWTIWWLNGLFRTGSQRQIEEQDLYQIFERRQARVLGQLLFDNWEAEKQRAELLRFIQESQSSKTPPPAARGYGLAVAVFVSAIVQNSVYQRWNLGSIKTGLYLRTALIDVVFRKATTLSAKSHLLYPDATIINLMSTDISRIDRAMMPLLIAIACPLYILVIVGLLVDLMGPAALLGAAFLMLSNPIQGWSLAKLAPVRKRASEFTDSRIRLSTEILQGIKVIKFFAWEKSFLAKLAEIRAKELALAIPVFASAISLVLFAALGHDLKPEIVFPALAYYAIMRVPLLILPDCYTASIDAYVAIKRVQAFLLSDDGVGPIAVDGSADAAITLEDANFVWETASAAAATVGPQHATDPTNGYSSTASQREDSSDMDGGKESGRNQGPYLRNINLKIARGSLVAVVGPVGSGKSSLLQAMIRNMTLASGSVTHGTTISYASQTPWIQNSSIRDNILFEMPFEEDRYWKTVRACCLEPDLASFLDRDLTEIGERGVNLSGGQKARLSLARSVYFDAGTVIMDDPLSAVDAHVGKRLWEDCILGKVLDGKTRVIATHLLHVLPDVDYIVYMSNGMIAEQGTYKDLMDKGGEFCDLIKQYGGVTSVKNEADSKGVTDSPRQLSKASIQQGLVDNENDQTLDNVNAHEARHGDAPVKAEPLTSAAKLMTEEEREAGAVSFHVYGGYFGAIGLGLWAVVVGFYVAQQVCGVVFSKDVDALDNVFWQTLNDILFTLLTVLGSVTLTVIFFPYLLLAIIPMAALYHWISVYYRATSREVKRLDSTLRSVLYAFFSESLTGMGTLKAYNRTEHAIQVNQQKLDLSNRPYFLFQVGTRWLAFRVQALGSLLIFMASMFAVGTRTTINAATAGLVLSSLARTAGDLNYLVQCIATLENNMNSAERLVHYIENLPQEPPAESASDQRPPPTWPTQGSIEFQHVVMRYRPELPSVLREVTFSVQAGHKIGVVGRTGAGKSSLIQALFLLGKLDSGRILIDGVDTQLIGTADLRTQIAIIPQDPVLFQGSFRYNLDPLERHAEQELWQVLETSDLKAYVQAQEGGLDALVSANGENLSVGQRQLVCLSRALLANSKIVVLDEGRSLRMPSTASVDMATDLLIQKAIRVEFAASTVITIAHRINTIIDYDRILVMHQGEVAEYDSPHNLLGDPHSAFSKLVSETGLQKTDRS
ncbi:hypothetical protein BGZ70_009361 [Mortierella alpina]|uniref:Uncharacterized protein n=1 Tax=Mortierella alpina TaxID=64518 RepID=A0A9P6J4S1_MORAP|nr:hypothetical protein BGZ70_009361 [Mortierella alpina]